MRFSVRFGLGCLSMGVLVLLVVKLEQGVHLIRSACDLRLLDCVNSLRPFLFSRARFRWLRNMLSRLYTRCDTLWFTFLVWKDCDGQEVDGGG